MHPDPSDRVAVAEADVLPRPSAIDAAIRAIALHDVAAQCNLTHAGVDDVRVRLALRKRADRRAVDVPVGDR
jgi:hypothetical protein